MIIGGNNMKNNLFTPVCKNNVGKTLFYIFEISALVIGVILFILAIVTAAQAHSFGVFVSGFVTAVINLLVIYGIGKIIDLLYLKVEGKNSEDDVVIEDKED